jgi:predicted enzyme related to lactoylglutathione lyase
MPHLSFINLYVKDATASAAFYSGLFGIAPLQTSPGFAMFATKSGLMLGFWSRDTVEPALSSQRGESAEICFTVIDTDAVHADWKARGLTIAQAPVTMGFGRTFTALDSDGHRLRVFTPPAT